MPLVRSIRAVWVPFEARSPEHVQEDAKGNPCADIPRFLTSQECKDFIQLNSRRIGARLIFFQEYTEEWAKQEFAKGVGKDAKYGWILPKIDQSDLDSLS